MFIIVFVRNDWTSSNIRSDIVAVELVEKANMSNPDESLLGFNPFLSKS